MTPEEEKAARAKASQERLAEKRELVAKARAAREKFNFQVNGKSEVVAVDKATNKVVAYMELGDKKRGGKEIKMVHVEPEVRRQGLASTLFLEAKKAGLKPVHSPTRSPEGDAFARRVGGYVPDMENTEENPTGDQRQAMRLRAQARSSNLAAGRERARQIALDRARNKPAAGGAIPRGIGVANRIAGPLGMVGFMFDAVKQINSARKPAAMLF